MRSLLTITTPLWSSSRHISIDQHGCRRILGCRLIEASPGCCQSLLSIVEWHFPYHCHTLHSALRRRLSNEALCNAKRGTKLNNGEEIEWYIHLIANVRKCNSSHPFFLTPPQAQVSFSWARPSLLYIYVTHSSVFDCVWNGDPFTR